RCARLAALKALSTSKRAFGSMRASTTSEIDRERWRERQELVEAALMEIVEKLKHEEDRTRAEQKAAIAPLEREIAYLRGQLDAVLGLLRKSLPVPEAKAGEVIDLPSGILRRRNDAA